MNHNRFTPAQREEQRRLIRTLYEKYYAPHNPILDVIKQLKEQSNGNDHAGQRDPLSVK